MKRTTTATLGLALGLALGGCYMQRPLETMSPPVNTRIVADLTDAGTVDMSNALGAGVLGVEGVVTAADAESWTLQMIRADLRDGRSIDWNREIVSFPRTAFANPSVVVFDKKRSWLAAGGITIGALLVARAFNLLGAPEEDEHTVPPEHTRIPRDR